MDLMIDDCAYEFRIANFQLALKEALKLTTLLKGAFVDGQVDIGMLLSNLNTKEFEEVSNFVFRYTTVVDESGKKWLLEKEKERSEYFNSHRSHYFKVLIDGVKFHFLDFLPTGFASSLNMNLLAVQVDSAM